jgi:hypothetical protein
MWLRLIRPQPTRAMRMRRSVIGGMGWSMKKAASRGGWGGYFFGMKGQSRRNGVSDVSTTVPIKPIANF